MTLDLPYSSEAEDFTGEESNVVDSLYGLLFNSTTTEKKKDAVQGKEKRVSKRLKKSQLKQDKKLGKKNSKKNKKRKSEAVKKDEVDDEVRDSIPLAERVKNEWDVEWEGRKRKYDSVQLEEETAATTVKKYMKTEEMNGGDVKLDDSDVDRPRFEEDADADMEVTNDDDDNISFGTFDFTNGKPTPMYLTKRKYPRITPKLIKKAEDRKQMFMDASEDAQRIAQDYRWGKVMSKAQGLKIKDDPQLLKKTLKRKEKSKEKSTRQWKQREKEVKHQMADRQKTRTLNIKNKMDERREKIKCRKLGIKLKKKNKKSKPAKRRPGFEGRKTKFINK